MEAKRLTIREVRVGGGGNGGRRDGRSYGRVRGRGGRS